MMRCLSVCSRAEKNRGNEGGAREVQDPECLKTLWLSDLVLPCAASFWALHRFHSSAPCPPLRCVCVCVRARVYGQRKPRGRREAEECE